MMLLVGFAGLCLLILAAVLDIRSRPEPKPIDPRCNSGARYEAMREAYEERLPDPCNPAAKEWVR